MTLIIGMFKASHEHKKPGEGTSLYLPTYVSVSLVVFRKLLLFPSCYAMTRFYSCFYLPSCMCWCDLALSCRGVGHIALAVLGTAIYLLIVALTLITAWFFADESPDSQLPWAVRNHRIEVLKIVKLMFGATMLGQNSTRGYATVCLLLLINADALVLYLHIICASYLNGAVQIFDIAFTSATVIYETYVFVLIVLK